MIAHVTNWAGDCVPWCAACADERRERAQRPQLSERQALEVVRRMAFDYRVAQGLRMPEPWAAHFRELEGIAAAALGQPPQTYTYETIHESAASELEQANAALAAGVSLLRECIANSPDNRTSWRARVKAFLSSLRGGK